MEILNTFTFLDFSQLNTSQLAQYHQSNMVAWPKIILNSNIVKSCWDEIEANFPAYQISLIHPNGRFIGRINTIPIFWDKPLQELPDGGWDWLVDRGLDGYKKGVKPNILGGLQVIVSQDFLGQGFSKKLIQAGKRVMESQQFQSFIIPIRPTKKSDHPEVKMEDYMTWKQDGRFFDPWINNHICSGAEIIKVCGNSMHISGDISFWENIIEKKISNTGSYIVEGALNPVSIDVDSNFGEYNEDNIWIKYS